MIINIRQNEILCKIIGKSLQTLCGILYFLSRLDDSNLSLIFIQHIIERRGIYEFVYSRRGKRVYYQINRYS